MGKIHKLDLFTANRIAAGEVVERPASVVKELVENAIDAGSSAINVEIKNGGIDLISVTDNGSGIAQEDALLAFARHATSKISQQNDLDKISTLGFRGEALCSIAAVAQVEMQSRIEEEESGSLLRVHGGVVVENTPFGCPPGTSFRVGNLFYNTPARLHFLKKPAYEGAAIGNIVARYIMANPHISFKFIQDGRQIYHSPGDGDLLTAIYCVYGRETVTSLLSLEAIDEENALSITGFISKPEGARPNRNAQSFFVNGRYVQSQTMSKALQNAYGHRLMIGKFPMAVLFVEVALDAVDVNIHPNKLEIRFKQEQELMELLNRATQEALNTARIVDWHYAEKHAEEQRPVVKSSVQTVQPGTYFSEEKALPADNPVGVENDGNQKETHPSPILENKEPPKKEPESEKLREEGIDDRTLREVRLDIEDVWTEPFRVREETNALLQEPLFVQPNGVDGDFTIVGQLFSTYIVLEAGEEIFLIDQHAAHERIIYDQMLANAGFGASQQLLIPYEMLLDGEDRALLEENTKTLHALGFSLTWEQDNLLQVNALPQLFEEAETGDFLLEAIEVLRNQPRNMVDSLKQDRLAQYACKHAIRGHDILSHDQMTALVKSFRDLEELNCPHGRPILIRITRKELEKLFKRIV